MEDGTKDYPDGEIIEVDFKQKRKLFKFGYYTNLQQARLIEEKLNEVYRLIEETSTSHETISRSKIVFKQIVERIENGD